MIFYNSDTNEKNEGKVKKTKLVRGYSFVNNNGVGYIYPLMKYEEDEDEGGKKYEMKISGECSCCVECMDDNNCDENEYCNENVCVECKNNDDCKGGIDMVCNKWRCLESGSCRNNDDCKDEKTICNDEGNCVSGCRNDNNCDPKEICSWDDNKCVKGCRIDDECESREEKCINFECTLTGCRNNFDCDDYDHVCIDNECVFLDDTNNCVDDTDCLGDKDYYCNYEYLVCVKHKRETLLNRRNSEVLPAVCSYYGIVSFFLIATSITYVYNIAREKLINVCDEKCSNIYYISSSSVSEEDLNISVADEEVDDSIDPVSECVGKCLFNPEILELKNKKNFIRWTDKMFFIANDNCANAEIIENVVRENILPVPKDKSLDRFNKVENFFYQLLSFECSRWTFDYEEGVFDRRTEACVADPDSVKCTRVDGLTWN